jgi:hypothetical protein
MDYPWHRESEDSGTEWRDALLRVPGHAAAFVSYGVPRKHVPPLPRGARYIDGGDLESRTSQLGFLAATAAQSAG